MPRKSYKRRADGRYRIMHDGIAFYSSVGGSVSEALAKIRQYEVDKANGLRAEMGDITVLEYASKWLPIHRHETNTKAYNGYASMLNRFVEHCGKWMRMRNVTKSDIKDFYNSLERYSASHIKKHVQTISAMFRDAVEDGVIIHSPCYGVKPPEGKAGTHRPIEAWEREIVHEMANEHRFGVAAMLMLYGGLRRGEALAFNIDRDVDFDAGRIYVRETVSFSEGIRGTVKEPKTDAGIRSVPLFEPLRAVLEGKHGLAVSQLDGSMMTLSSFDRAWESYIYQIEKRMNGFSRRWANGREWKHFTVRTHDFRHSFCTMICDAGVDIKTAMKWMGHSDAKMIQKIYDHVMKERELAAEQKTALQVQKMLDEQAKRVKSRVIINFPSEKVL